MQSSCDGNFDSQKKTTKIRNFYVRNGTRMTCRLGIECQREEK